MSRGKLIIFNILQWILVAYFLFEGLTNLFGASFQMMNFVHWEFPSWTRLAIGGGELFFTIILMSDYRRFAVGWLTALMLLVIYLHFTHGELQQLGVAVVMLILLRVSDRLKKQGRLDAGML